jgi:AcrR family transcriptional regulator
MIEDDPNQPADYSVSEGLRERKKRLMRQLISDTATEMFMARGFDEVRVSEVAAACDISEKTIYNYFPTKESLLLDREEPAAENIRAALGPDAKDASPIDAAVAVLEMETTQLFGGFDAKFTHKTDLTQVRRFADLIESTPSLRAAQRDMVDRLVQVAAESMAARAGVNPEDPEPQIAAQAIVGLWRIQFRAMERYSDGTRSARDVCEAVMDDVRRAARLIETGIWSFGMAVQGANSREQLKTAADAASDASKQVAAAIKEARNAWRQAIREVQIQHPEQVQRMEARMMRREEHLRRRQRGR